MEVCSKMKNAKSTDSVEVMKRSGNFAVLRFSDRAYPGVFIQGDTFHRVLQALGSDQEQCQEAIDELKLLAKLYEQALREIGIELPYRAP